MENNQNTYARLSTPLLTAGLFCIVLFMPWRTFLTNASIFGSVLIWIFFIKVNRKNFTKENSVFILLFGALYFIEVVGMIHTENVSYGLFRLETKLPLIMLPVIILTSTLERKNIELIFIGFISSTVLACTWCVIVALKSIYDKGQGFSSFFVDPTYSYINLTAPIQQIHPTYLSLFICLSIFLMANYIRRNRKRYFLIFVILYLIFFAFQLASRAGIISLLVTLFIIGADFIGLHRKALLALYFFVVILMIVITVFSIPTIKHRLFDSVIEADVDEEQFNSVSYHYKAWTCSLEKWMEDHFFFGYGTGDETLTLRRCYEEKGWISYGHDAHNEYLSSLVKHGIVGLCILLASLLYPLYVALKNRNSLYVTFLSIIMICFLSESMLRAQTGLVFYAFFNALILKYVLDSKQTREVEPDRTVELS